MTCREKVNGEGLVTSWFKTQRQQTKLLARFFKTNEKRYFVTPHMNWVQKSLPKVAKHLFIRKKIQKAYKKKKNQNQTFRETTVKIYWGLLN